jgi:hypothetical protein
VRDLGPMSVNIAAAAAAVYLQELSLQDHLAAVRDLGLTERQQQQIADGYAVFSRLLEQVLQVCLVKGFTLYPASVLRETECRGRLRASVLRETECRGRLRASVLRETEYRGRLRTAPQFSRLLEQVQQLCSYVGGSRATYLTAFVVTCSMQPLPSTYHRGYCCCYVFCYIDVTLVKPCACRRRVGCSRIIRCLVSSALLLLRVLYHCYEHWFLVCLHEAVGCSRSIRCLVTSS